MNKQAIVAALAKTGDISKAEAERRLNHFLDVISAVLKSGDDVTLSGIGKLKVVSRQARMGRNPNTGAALQIPAKKTIRIRQSSNLEI
jgi:DNA-binding protein HU-beta